ncbi:MAG: hypothetical protein QW718_03890 [Nitrososphaerota archaeon]
MKNRIISKPPIPVSTSTPRARDRNFTAYSRKKGIVTARST